MDIGSGNGFPEAALSNFPPRPFTLDGVAIASMEGWLQSLKFDKPHIQEVVCTLVGLVAKRRGQKRNKAWKSTQTLWWRGVPMARDSQAYQDLLDRGYQAAFDQHEGFRKALDAAEGAVLRHSIGKSKITETVLTEREMCSRLTKLRDGIRLTPAS
jgi:predicted NAD-dependent protein-ADP-ribosyltransferase YbiA (DUF1768 family)